MNWHRFINRIVENDKMKQLVTAFKTYNSVWFLTIIFPTGTFDTSPFLTNFGRQWLTVIWVTMHLAMLMKSNFACSSIFISSLSPLQPNQQCTWVIRDMLSMQKKRPDFLLKFIQIRYFQFGLVKNCTKIEGQISI